MPLVLLPGEAAPPLQVSALGPGCMQSGWVIRSHSAPRRELSHGQTLLPNWVQERETALHQYRIQGLGFPLEGLFRPFHQAHLSVMWGETNGCRGRELDQNLLLISH